MRPKWHKSPKGRDIISYQPVQWMTFTRFKWHSPNNGDRLLVYTKKQAKADRWEKQMRAPQRKQTSPSEDQKNQTHRQLKSSMQEEKQTIPKPKEHSNQVPHWGTGIFLFVCLYLSHAYHWVAPIDFYRNSNGSKNLSGRSGAPGCTQVLIQSGLLSPSTTCFLSPAKCYKVPDALRGTAGRISEIKNSQQLLENYRNSWHGVNLPQATWTPNLGPPGFTRGSYSPIWSHQKV